MRWPKPTFFAAAATRLGLFARRAAAGLAVGFAAAGHAATPVTPVPPRPAPGTATTPIATPAGLAVRTSSATASGWMQQAFTSDGVTATFAIPGDMIPGFGFVPVRMTVDNTTARELRWRVTLLLMSYSPIGQTEGETERVLVIPPGRGSERWIFVPTADSGSSRNYRGGYFTTYGNLSIMVTGPNSGNSRVGFSSSGGRGNQMVPWAVSSSLEAALRARISGLTTTSPRPGAGPPISVRRGRGGALPPTAPTAAAPAPVYPLVPGAPSLTVFDLSQAFGDARIFQPFPRFVMGLEEYAVLNPATKAALRNWVALGGWLYLSPDQPRAGATQEVLGVGRITTLARPVKDEGDDGHGLFAPAGLFELTPAVPNNGDLTLQAGSAASLPSKVPRARRVGDWLIYFFIGFAALVAPVNLLLIAPVKRRHRLFFSLPGISAVAVAVLAVAIYTQDGVAGEGARRSLVVLLPGDNAAAVFQDQIARTGLLLRATFPVPEDVVCAELVADDTNYQVGRALRYDRQDGTASGDWFRGRTRQAQHLRRIVPTRARVERVGQTAEGAPIVQSSVGAPLRSFIYYDAAGLAWAADRLPLGQPVTLKRLTDDSASMRQLAEFASSASVHFKQLVQGATAIQAPHRFIAFAEPTELAPIPTLASIVWKESEVLLAGFVAGAPNAGGVR